VKHNRPRLPGLPGPTSALYAVITATRSGALLGRVRLDAPEAQRWMAALIAGTDGAVTINVEESEDASDAGSSGACAWRAAA
jgi:hypothetical protein